MYALEHLKLQGTVCCWKQFAICGSRVPLDKVRAGLRCPADWRVIFAPGSIQAAVKQLREAA